MRSLWLYFLSFFSVGSVQLVYEDAAAFLAGEAAMAMVCWSFVMVLLLTLAALVAPSQPPAGPYHVHIRDSESSKAAIENRNSHYATGGSDVERSWNVLVGRRGRFRRLVERGNADLVCDQQLNCKRRDMAPSTLPVDSDRARNREILANYRLPQVKRMVHLNSDRMVPTGPNPLHNSNRSQVIFP